MCVAGVCEDMGQPVLLPPGMHQWHSGTLKFEKEVRNDHLLTLLGNPLLTLLGNHLHTLAANAQLLKLPTDRLSADALNALQLTD